MSVRQDSQALMFQRNRPQSTVGKENADQVLTVSGMLIDTEMQLTFDSKVKRSCIGARY